MIFFRMYFLDDMLQLQPIETQKGKKNNLNDFF